MKKKMINFRNFKSNTAAFAAVLLLTSALFTGCGKEEEPPVPETTAAAAVEETLPVPQTQAEEPVRSVEKVAMITDFGPVADSYVNQECWAGLKEWCEDNGVAYTCYEPAEDTTEERVLCVVQAIAEGADTLVLSGYLFGPVLAVVQDVYPDVAFLAIDVAADDITIDYETMYDPAGNVTCLTFREEEIGYLAGYAAVREGFRNLGYLGSMETDAVIRSGSGFVQGADAAARELEVEISVVYDYAGQYFGSSALTSGVMEWYRSGVEAVFSCGGGIYTSVVEAAEELEGKVIGFETDRADLASCVITSGVKDFRAVTKLALQRLRDGRWEELGGKALRLSLSDEDCLGLAAEGDSWRLENFTVEEYRAVKEKIAAGTLKVESGILHPDSLEVSEFTTVSGMEQN